MTSRVIGIRRVFYLAIAFGLVAIVVSFYGEEWVDIYSPFNLISLYRGNGYQLAEYGPGIGGYATSLKLIPLLIMIVIGVLLVDVLVGTFLRDGGNVIVQRMIGVGYFSCGFVGVIVELYYFASLNVYVGMKSEMERWDRLVIDYGSGWIITAVGFFILISVGVIYVWHSFQGDNTEFQAEVRYAGGSVSRSAM
jgi:hypothetical protein